MANPLTINLLDVLTVLAAQLELGRQLGPVVDGVHDGLGLVGVRQSQHVPDLVHGHAKQVDAVGRVGSDGFEVLLVVEVHVSCVLGVGDLAAVAVEVVLAVLVGSCNHRQPWRA